MKWKLSVLTVVAGLLLAAWPVRAHHSFAAEYDKSKPLKLTGTVTKFDLTNPHSWIYIDVTGTDGKVVNWGFETASPSNLYRRGFRKDTVKVGTSNYQHLVYHLPAPPDPVTGKRVPSIVDRYYVPGPSGLAIVSLSTPDGVDNVDAFRQMIESFRWS